MNLSVWYYSSGKAEAESLWGSVPFTVTKILNCWVAFSFHLTLATYSIAADLWAGVGGGGGCSRQMTLLHTDQNFLNFVQLLGKLCKITCWRPQMVGAWESWIRLLGTIVYKDKFKFEPKPKIYLRIPWKCWFSWTQTWQISQQW